MSKKLALSRSQILSFRRRAGLLDQRRPAAAASLRRAAWAGLQDSMPRAALLSLHARVSGATPATWQHPSLVQLWGPRFHDYVVSEKDRALFSLGRLPLDGPRHQRAVETAKRLHAFLRGRKLPFGKAGRAMGVSPNSLRYAALTGTLHLFWDGTGQPKVWTVPAPAMDPQRARLELARRYLHIFGPATADSFGDWAGVSAADARRSMTALAGELLPVRSPTGDAWILAADESGFRAPRLENEGARLLPSGDAYFLLWGADRKLLVPDAKRRAALWTSRVWPGAILVRGEIAGTWRRPNGTLEMTFWRKLNAADREAVEMEAAGLPIS